MTKRASLNYGTIVKRSSCINSIAESGYNNLDSRLELIRSQLESVSNNNILGIKQSVKSFVESISNYNDANRYYKYPLFFVDKLNEYDTKFADKLIDVYTNRVMPYVENLSCVEEITERLDLTSSQKDKLDNTGSLLQNADRIIKNHSMISNRFNIENDIKFNSIEDIVENVCTLIDTYDLPNYQKMNLCIEELYYLIQKNNGSTDLHKIPDCVTEYFMFRQPKYSEKDMKGFRKVLNENCFLKEDDIDDNPLIERMRGKGIIEKLKCFIANPEKSVDSFMELLFEILDESTILIARNFDRIIWIMWKIYSSDIFSEETTRVELQNKYYDIWINALIRRITDNLFIGENDNDPLCVKKYNIATMIDLSTSTLNLIHVKSTDSYEYGKSISEFKHFIQDHLIKKLCNISEIMYSDDCVRSIYKANTDIQEAVSLQEFKIFKFNNLVKASLNLNKFLKIKAKNFMNKAKKKIKHPLKKVHNILFGESNRIENFVGTDHRVDICVEQYEFDESCIEEVHEFFTSICNEFNHKLQLESNHTTKAYYTINSNIVEVHLKEATPIDLDDQELNEFMMTESPDLDYYIESFSDNYIALESFDNSNENPVSILESIMTFHENKDLTMEHFEVALEAMKFLNVSKEDVELFAERFNNYRYDYVIESGMSEYESLTESKHIRSLVKEWNKYEEVPYDIQLEAYEIFKSVLEDKKIDTNPNANKIKSDKKAKGRYDYLNKNHIKDLKKNPPKREGKKGGLFKGIKINSLKLSLEGLKSKFKDMSQKQKELSRQIDNASKLLVKGMKDALISDRREAIIKGSVIPSFGKALKIGIGLMGAGLITGNPTVPIVAAIGGFAVSKRLTQKERILLLDEIETELQVLEKEISMAESNNQMNKYRALLTTKKDLQRQYQRIRYNVRVGKDLLPGSTVGVKKFDD